VLRPGEEYAWLLDYFVAGSAIGFISVNTGIGSYADGTALRFVNGPGFPTGTRADNFALDNWFEDPFTDFAFELTYTSVPVPEPGASLLVVGGILVALRRRRSRP